MPPRISIAASPELVAALDADAFAYDETRSAAARRILVDHLRDAGRMRLNAPPTHQLGQTNRRYLARGVR